MVGFPCIVMVISFCFNINTKVTKLESDYRHLDRNMKQGLDSIQLQINSMADDIKKLLKHAGEAI